MEYYYLAHHGVTGMKWGVMHGPPYPLRRTANGRLDTKTQLKLKIQAAKSDYAARIQRRRQNRADKKLEVLADKESRRLEKEEKKAAKLAAKETRKVIAEEKARKAEADRKEALKQYVRHHPTEFPKYADAFTKDEIDDIVSRISLDRKLKDIRNQEVDRYIDRMNKAVNALQTVKNGAESSIAIYNATASVWNAIGEASAAKKGAKFTPLKRIGGKGDNDGKQKQPNK